MPEAPKESEYKIFYRDPYGNFTESILKASYSCPVTYRKYPESAGILIPLEEAFIPESLFLKEREIGYARAQEELTPKVNVTCQDFLLLKKISKKYQLLKELFK